MSIGREESLFLTVSENHRKRTCPEYVQKMSEPFEHAGGMAELLCRSEYEVYLCQREELTDFFT